MNKPKFNKNLLLENLFRIIVSSYFLFMVSFNIYYSSGILLYLFSITLIVFFVFFITTISRLIKDLSYKDSDNQRQHLDLIFEKNQKNADKPTMLKSVKKNGIYLSLANDKLKDDRDIVLEAVRNIGWSLEYASEKLKDDKDIVLEAVRNSGQSLEYASARLMDDKDIVSEAVKNQGWALEYASKRLQSDTDIKFLTLESICKKQLN